MYHVCMIQYDIVTDTRESQKLVSKIPWCKQTTKTLSQGEKTKTNIQGCPLASTFTQTHLHKHTGLIIEFG